MAIISEIVFGDDDNSIRFVEEWFNLQPAGLTGYGKLVSSYKLPTLFCDQITPRPHKREGWTFRQTRGWWVCPFCLRPSAPTNNDRFLLHGSYGWNILDKIKNSQIGDKL